MLHTTNIDDNSDCGRGWPGCDSTMYQLAPFMGAAASDDGGPFHNRRWHAGTKQINIHHMCKVGVC